MIWVLSGYEKDGEKLIVQHDLAGVTADFLRSVVGLKSGEPVVASYPLSAPALSVLSQFTDPPPDPELADYYLEAFSSSDRPEEYSE